MITTERSVTERSHLNPISDLEYPQAPVQSGRIPRWLMSLLIAGFISTQAMPAFASALGDLAAKMNPGQWAEFPTNGFNNGGILVTDDGDGFLQYTDEALWDPIKRQIYVIGTSRGNSAQYGMINQKWIAYSEGLNTWTVLPQLPFYIGFHSYDHAALDTRTGDYYVKIVGGDFATDREVHKFTASSQTWSKLPDMPVSGDAPCCSALEYFPELGGIVYVNPRDNGGEFYLYNPSTNAWSTIPGGFSGDYSQFSEYNRVHKFLYFGGGAGAERNLYKLDANKKVTRLADAPVTLGTASGCAGVQTLDPLTGKLIVFSCDQGRNSVNGTYEYNPVTNSWSKTGTHNLAYGDLEAVAVPLFDYGVIFVIVYTGNGAGKVYLYKHSTGSPAPVDTTPPAPPSNVKLK